MASYRPKIKIDSVGNLEDLPLDAETLQGSTKQQIINSVTKAQVGLGNVDNTSDLNKPISTATQSALNSKLGKTETASNSNQLEGSTKQQIVDEARQGLATDTKVNGIDTKVDGVVVKANKNEGDIVILNAKALENKELANTKLTGNGWETNNTPGAITLADNENYRVLLINKTSKDIVIGNSDSDLTFEGLDRRPHYTNGYGTKEIAFMDDVNTKLGKTETASNSNQLEGSTKQQIIDSVKANIPTTYIKEVAFNANTTQLIFTRGDGKKLDINTLFLHLHPVGSIYISTSSTSPASTYGGSWELLRDRFLIGAGNSYSGGATGGSTTVTLTESQMPEHYHVLNYAGQPIKLWSDNNSQVWNSGGIKTNWGGGSQTAGTYETARVGGSQPHSNMPPYLAVYMWKRLA